MAAVAFLGNEHKRLFVSGRFRRTAEMVSSARHFLGRMGRTATVLAADEATQRAPYAGRVAALNGTGQITPSCQVLEIAGAP